LVLKPKQTCRQNLFGPLAANHTNHTPKHGDMEAIMSQATDIPEAQKTSPGEFLTQVVCATIFLAMIGLVFYNAFIRYVFRSSFPPSEEWARFLFMYITFLGSIEAFYRNRHIAVDLFVGLLSGRARKTVDTIAHVFTLAALVFLFCGGIVLVRQTLDTNSVATGINMGIINGVLPLMAFLSFFIRLRDFIRFLKRPVSDFKKEAGTKVQELIENESMGAAMAMREAKISLTNLNKPEKPE
jgi:TRAP-type C4-dicarboxylate transport system permease small subunit